MPLLGLPGPPIGLAEADGVVAPELEEHGLAVQLACACRPVTRPAADNGAVDEADFFKCADGTPNPSLSQAKVGTVGKLASVYRERRHEPRRRAPEPPEERRKGEGGVTVARRCQRRDEAVPDVMGQAVRAARL